MVKVRRLALLVVGGALLSMVLSTAGVRAHHSNSAYDTTKTVSVKGIVKRWQLVNPHSGLWFEVTDAQGTKLWAGEFTGTLDLYRKLAWNKNTFKPGDTVTVIGNPARDGSSALMARKVIFADGKEADLEGT